MVGRYLFTFLGYDVDGDGRVDSLPATSTNHIKGVAVYEKKCFEHIFAESAVLQAPTHTADGERLMACDCGATRIEVISKETELPLFGHTVIHHNEKAATCTEHGWYAYETCENCDHTTYVEIPAIGHSYGAWTETEAPTCTEKGAERRDCTRCDHYETREVAALGHDTVQHGTQAVTCTEHGWNAYETCTRCDYTTYEEIPASGHHYGKWKVTIAPTYAEKGEECRDCEMCDHYETREIAKLTCLQEFVDCVNALSENASTDVRYSEIYAALQLYAKLTEEEKEEAKESVLHLQQMMEAYNEKANGTNEEMQKATEIAFLPISASFVFLAALWFLLKKKFWLK